MKRFIRNLLIFVIIISSITAAVNYVYISRKGPDRYSINKFALVPDMIQICNFGTSHGMRFSYEDLENEYACFNFALSAQSLSYDYRLFQYYGDRIVEGAVVFIPISYFTLFGRGEVSESDFLSKNTRYYPILPASLIKNYDYKTYLLFRYLPALTANTGDLILSLLKTTMVTNEEALQKVVADEDIGESAKLAFDSHVGNRKYYDIEGNRIENQEEIDALYALVKGCQEKGAVPILISTPYLHEYTDLIKENTADFYDQYYSIIDRVVKDTGVEYYDYAFDERYINKPAWFNNADHLNMEGGRKFVDILMREIVYAKGYYPEK